MPKVNKAQALAFTQPVNDIAEFWNDLVHLMDEQGLMMGTAFDHPGLVITGAKSPRKQGCATSLSKC